MIEGGSKVLSSFLHAAPRADGSAIVDTVVVTVAPTFIGDGVGFIPKVCLLQLLWCTGVYTDDFRELMWVCLE